MSSRRTAKVAEAIREIVSTTVLFELKDPRVKNVTVLRADVSPDLRSAKVYVSVMGDEKTESLSMHGLNSARGFIQSKLADRLQTRYTPVLQFVLDKGIKLSAQTSAILRQTLRDRAAEGEEPSAEADAPPPGDSEEPEAEAGDSSEDD